MRRLMVGLVLVAVVWIAVMRQRLFLRDVVGRVYVNGVRVDGSRVFINYSNDVLVLREGMEPLMVQGWDRLPGVPRRLSCARGMACLTEADRAEKVPVSGYTSGDGVTMSRRDVTMHGEDGVTRVSIW